LSIQGAGRILHRTISSDTTVESRGGKLGIIHIGLKNNPTTMRDCTHTCHNNNPQALIPLLGHEGAAEESSTLGS
ncbi:hypothetical protein A2U01_0035510, partial [Trifolium medium]|nr:hypothetical protein [Trifolium medium]